MQPRLRLFVGALMLLGIAILMPSDARGTCDPAGTRFFRTSYLEWNPVAGNGVPCPPPPEEAYCFLGAYDPPTTCCNGYHVEIDPLNPDNCYYCRDEWYVCD